MKRKGWDQLSPAYRKRLERGGVSKRDYQTGKSLSKGRGHANTPERPKQAEKHPEKFGKYLARKRDKVVKHIQKQLGSEPRFNLDTVKKGVGMMDIEELDNTMYYGAEELKQKAASHPIDEYNKYWYH